MTLNTILDKDRWTKKKRDGVHIRGIGEVLR